MDRYEALEAELVELKAQKNVWERERRRLRRNCELLSPENGDLRDLVENLRRDLREREQEIEQLVKKNGIHLENLKEICTKYEFLEEEMVKVKTHLGEVKGERNHEVKKIKELSEKIGVLERDLLEIMREKDVKISELEKEKEGLEMEVKVHLEEVKRERNHGIVRMKEFSEKIRVLEREKDEKIQQVDKEKKGLEMEKREVIAKLDEVEERLLKIEEDVIRCMCLDLKRDQRFSTTEFGKILSGTVKGFNLDDLDHTCNVQEADSACHIIEPICCLKSNKQSEEAVRSSSIVGTENLQGNVAIRETGTAECDVIILDSKSDSENSLHIPDVKSRLRHTVSFTEKCNRESSDDDSLNQKHKRKKLEHVPHESSPLPTPKDDHNHNIYLRQPLATIRKCETKLSTDVRESSDYSYGSMKANQRWSPRLEEYISVLRQRKDSKKLEYAADMVCALDEDADLRAKAICALYRQHNCQTSSVKDTLCERSKGLEEHDAERVVTLAKFLIDGDSNGQMKQSVHELRQHDPRGLDDCRRLAMKYSKQLIDIYKKGADPLFSPLSTDLQYN